ncbi:metallophosphoesterase [Bradyrhizobium sp. AUGA SZCCT0431]|uniref:metallophosphoesterase n=1 Tax=Bradyrhizobium sp. AUGA SZCCT0431 TaxID=2807674 RepID=UPI001BAC0BA5|nr:metallophosphoesterase [Bradyrhizobium sp. AUGA SZCCT0431]MBR1146666.1 metallophosphoesterase [Bradyrhizobium sp. AUGA SZCCT0431]
METIKRWLVLTDIHAPYEDKRSLAAVEKLMADLRFDGYLNLGDFIDFDCISSHNKNNLRAVEGKRIHLEYDAAAVILDRHQKLIRSRNKDAEFVFLQGNHEFRVDRYLDANPQLEGMIEVPTCLEFGRRKIKWVPSWSKNKVYKIGKANFIHGRYGGENHAKKHVTKYGCNIFYGHIHDVQCHSAEMLGVDNTMVGQSLGCLCLPQSYMHGAPDKWQQALTIFEFFPDGNFTYNVIRIFKHRFSYNGKVYSG